MTKTVKGFVCAEQTADGLNQFAVESREAFNAYVELSEMGSAEAAHWGGFHFDIDPNSNRDADGHDLDEDKLEKCQVITMAEINSAKAAIIGDGDDDYGVEDPDMDEDEDSDGYDGCDSVYEIAFLAVRDGDFRK